MDRSGGASEADGWFAKVGAFMTEVGTIPAAPDPKALIDTSYMKRVAADPKLKALATEFDRRLRGRAEDNIFEPTRRRPYPGPRTEDAWP